MQWNKIPKANFISINFKKCIDRELEILPSLTHRNIVKYEGKFEDKNYIYLIFEYLRNGNIRKFLKKNGPISLELARIWTIEIISALKYLEEQSLVHRDIKPENILLDNNYHIKLCDFGASKYFSREEAEDAYEYSDVEDESLTSDSSICTTGKTANPPEAATFTKMLHSLIGTRWYKSPEQIEGKPPSFGTDLWAVGCVLYEALFAKFPFGWVQNIDVEERILHWEYERVKVTKEEETPEMAAAIDLISKLFKKRPIKRLGGGVEGSEESFENLKQHPFFQPLNFDLISEEEVPIDAEIKLSAFEDFEKLKTPFKPQEEDVKDTLSPKADFSTIPFMVKKHFSPGKMASSPLGLKNSRCSISSTDSNKPVFQKLKPKESFTFFKME